MKRNLVGAILLCGFILALIWVARVADPRAILRGLLERISHLGPSAPYWFMLAYVIACLTFVPGIILTLGAGVLFGVVWGTLYVCVGATIGASLAFLTSRYLARGRLLRTFQNHPKFRLVDEAVAREGWKIAGLIRLSPAFPFIPMNFVFGLTKIPLWQFSIVTFFSIIPLTALFAYLGSLIGDITALGNQPVAQGKMKWIVAAVGVTTTLVVTLFITRMARRVLSQKLPPGADPELASEPNFS